MTDIPSDYWQLRELYMEKCLEHEALRKAISQAGGLNSIQIVTMTLAIASQYKQALDAAVAFINSRVSKPGPHDIPCEEYSNYVDAVGKIPF